MLSVRLSEVPEYLKEGEFHRTLQGENDGDDNVIVPADCYHEHKSIASPEDFENLLKTLRFWIVTRIPKQLLDYMIGQKGGDEDIIATFANDLPMLDLIQSIATSYNRMDEAASVGAVEIVTYLHEEVGDRIGRKALEYAASNGHLPMLVYANEQQSLVRACYECAQNGANWCCSTCPHYIDAQGCEWDYNTPAEAARRRQYDCMRYALDNGCEWMSEEFGHYEDYLVNCAVEGGNLDCLIYAHKLGGTWDENTCVIAAEHGNFACLQYLHEHGCPWDEYVYENAVMEQHADCVEYLLANDCPGYDPVCTIRTTSGDNLWLLQIAHKPDLPWNKYTMRHAKQMKYKESIKYLKDHDCPTM